MNFELNFEIEMMNDDETREGGLMKSEDIEDDSTELGDSSVHGQNESEDLKYDQLVKELFPGGTPTPEQLIERVLSQSSESVGEPTLIDSDSSTTGSVEKGLIPNHDKWMKAIARAPCVEMAMRPNADELLEARSVLVKKMTVKAYLYKTREDENIQSRAAEFGVSYQMVTKHADNGDYAGPNIDPEYYEKVLRNLENEVSYIYGMDFNHRLFKSKLLSVVAETPLIKEFYGFLIRESFRKRNEKIRAAAEAAQTPSMDRTAAMNRPVPDEGAVDSESSANGNPGPPPPTLSVNRGVLTPMEIEVMRYAVGATQTVRDIQAERDSLVEERPNQEGNLTAGGKVKMWGVNGWSAMLWLAAPSIVNFILDTVNYFTLHAMYEYIRQCHAVNISVALYTCTTDSARLAISDRLYNERITDDSTEWNWLYLGPNRLERFFEVLYVLFPAKAITNPKTVGCVKYIRDKMCSFKYKPLCDDLSGVQHFNEKLTATWNEIPPEDRTAELFQRVLNLVLKPIVRDCLPIPIAGELLSNLVMEGKGDRGPPRSVPEFRRLLLLHLAEMDTLFRTMGDTIGERSIETFLNEMHSGPTSVAGNGGWHGPSRKHGREEQMRPAQPRPRLPNAATKKSLEKLAVSDEMRDHDKRVCEGCGSTIHYDAANCHWRNHPNWNESDVPFRKTNWYAGLCAATGKSHLVKDMRANGQPIDPPVVRWFATGAEREAFHAHHPDREQPLHLGGRGGVRGGYGGRGGRPRGRGGAYGGWKSQRECVLNSTVPDIATLFDNMFIIVEVLINSGYTQVVNYISLEAPLEVYRQGDALSEGGSACHCGELGGSRNITACVSECLDMSSRSGVVSDMVVVSSSVVSGCVATVVEPVVRCVQLYNENKLNNGGCLAPHVVIVLPRDWITGLGRTRNSKLFGMSLCSHRHDEIAVRNKPKEVERMITLRKGKSMRDTDKDQQADRNNRLLKTGGVINLDRTEPTGSNAPTRGRREEIIRIKEWFETRDDSKFRNDDHINALCHTSPVAEINISDDFVTPDGNEGSDFKQKKDICLMCTTYRTTDIFSIEESQPDPTDRRDFDHLWRCPRNQQNQRLQVTCRTAPLIQKQELIQQQVNQLIGSVDLCRFHSSGMMEYPQVLTRPGWDAQVLNETNRNSDTVHCCINDQVDNDMTTLVDLMGRICDWTPSYLGLDLSHGFETMELSNGFVILLPHNRRTTLSTIYEEDCESTLAFDSGVCDRQ